MVNQVVNKVFLSHKAICSAQAVELARALDEVTPGAGIFRSEGIREGHNWRDEIQRQLANAKCFILLYTNPELDWSWCFYEAGEFVSKGRKPRPVYCLHPTTVDPPSPLAYLQTIPAERSQIETWLKRDLCPLLKGRRKQPEHKCDSTVRDIERLVNAAGPPKEIILKPYIWIEPKWSGNQTATASIPDDVFAHAAVSIDPISSRQLGFADPPKLALLPFLRQIACEASEGKIEFWIKKFFESLQSATREHLNFQELAYFRHENGKIYRPLVESYAKDASGTRFRLRVIFAEAFVSPLTDSPGLVQLLSNGARLAVRTQLEVLDRYLGHTSEIYREKVTSTRLEDEVARNNPVGRRVVETLDAILREAVSHGTRPSEDAPCYSKGKLRAPMKTSEPGRYRF